jgi:CheY-like chemotaxis protein
MFRWGATTVVVGPALAMAWTVSVWTQHARHVVKGKEPIRLLLVDDETEFLEAITPGLVRRGFALALAEDGQTALRLLARQSFDAVVPDVKMPGIDGIEVFHRIRRFLPELPVVLLTRSRAVQEEQIKRIIDERPD